MTVSEEAISPAAGEGLVPLEPPGLLGKTYLLLPHGVWSGGGTVALGLLCAWLSRVTFIEGSTWTGIFVVGAFLWHQSLADFRFRRDCEIAIGTVYDVFTVEGESGPEPRMYLLYRFSPLEDPDWVVEGQQLVKDSYWAAMLVGKKVPVQYLPSKPFENRVDVQGSVSTSTFLAMLPF